MPNSSELPENTSSKSLETQDLPSLGRLGNAILLDRLKATLVQSRWLASVDVSSETSNYLGRFDSKATSRTYKRALEQFLGWCEAKALHPYMVSRPTADLYISGLVATNLKPSSVAVAVAAVSAWYTWLERRHPVRNPFRGTRGLRSQQSPKVLEYPNDWDIVLILLWCSPLDAAGVATMAYRGLRVGALPSLVIRGDSFEAHSKGSTVSGILPPTVLAFIDALGVDQHTPFCASTSEQWSSRLSKKMSRLAGAGIIRAAYSAHDLRHYYASREYRKDHDLDRLGRLLGHTSMEMTERYVHEQLGL